MAGIIDRVEHYRGLGLKLTPQRLAILQFLEGNREHPSAEDIYNAVKKRFPTMSFATVYNTLEVLRKRGLIRELAIDGERKRYDPDIEPHHHILCVRCKRVADVHLDIDVPLPEEASQGFAIFGTHIEFYGLCDACSSASSEEAETNKKGGAGDGSL